MYEDLDRQARENYDNIIIKFLPGGDIWYYDVMDKMMHITKNMKRIKYAYDKDGRIYSMNRQHQKVYFYPYGTYGLDSIGKK